MDFECFGKAGSPSSTTDFALRTRLVEAWLLWVFEELVARVIKAHFYVTDTSVHKSRIFYFRKPVGFSTGRIKKKRKIKRRREEKN
jgi:hypothetical protein